MSKRGQKGTSRESSAMAKPRLLSAKRDSAQDMSDSDNPRNAKAEQGGISTCDWKQVRNTQPNTLKRGNRKKLKNADSWKQEKEKRRFALNLLLESEAKCGHTQE